MRLVLFFDGTWNEPNDLTNVDLLYQRTAESPDQRSLYIPGVGTRDQGLFALADKFLGGAFGQGLTQNIKTGYRWICERYMPGAQIFIFGFSRGAYSARSLAGLIRKCGVIRDVTDPNIDQAYSIYRDASSSTDERITEYRQSHSQECDIEFVGVWDTVGELGIPVGGLQIPGFNDYYKFHDTSLSNSTKAAYHAVAANEFRSLYAPTLWTKGKDDRGHLPVEQRWFIGAHANVGGGYTSPPRHPADLLPLIPARWLLDVAVTHGLKIDHSIDVPLEAYSADPIDSYDEFVGHHLFLKQAVQREARSPNGGLNETTDMSLRSRLDTDLNFLREFPELRVKLLSLPDGDSA
jgi:uncharacterized protein (DUF2235 family)